jgi:transposase
MKYSEFSVNKKLFGDDYVVYDWKESDEEVHIFLKSKTGTGKCPECDQESNSLHATYQRNIQITPINMKTTYVHVLAYKYDCCNDECTVKVFMEELSFAGPSQVRSTELNLLILAVSIFLSNEGSSRVLRLIGIKVSNDTIKRIYDSIVIKDEADVDAVGIDDVAIRKGQSYATAIYDLKDHHLIALLNGRDAETLKEWLKNHSKIRVVARDRASAYANAINEILPDCIQVADRFHLLQNLIERMKDIFNVELPKEIFIKDGEVMDSAPEKVKKLKVSPDSKQLNEYDYNNEAPVDEDGNLVSYDSKNRNPNRESYRKQAESRKKNSR